MNDRLTILSAQLNATVGDVDANLEKALAALDEAHATGADLVVLPELFLCGYPPEDLVLKPALSEACMRAAKHLAAKTRIDGPGVVIGLPVWDEGEELPYNSVALIADGEIKEVRHKYELPNYDVFDEKRTFKQGPKPLPVGFRGYTLGLPICEDIWLEAVPDALKEKGAEILISPNGSPWRRNAREARLEAFSKWADLRLPLVYVNQVGGQDEIAFDGESFAIDARGRIVQQLPDFEEAYDVTVWERTPMGLMCVEGKKAELCSDLEETYLAAMMGLGDYVKKTGFPGVLIGLSGGIDSAIVAAIAVDALGADNVWCVMMPSRYTSQESLQDAKQCAEALGVKYEKIIISPAVSAFDKMLASSFAETTPDTTEENIQSRIRGLTLMALSNKFGHMVTTTGNKSEMAVGYATLYGDMCGGYNPLKDIYKTEVFELARWRNANVPKNAEGPSGIVIPENIITKPPSAELREDQKDEDSLPPYHILDDILYGLIEREESIETIVERGHFEDTVRRIDSLVRINEYKRRQAPPGVKIGDKNFGRGRRYPLVNRYRDA
ncbi:NAD+ synthase [Hirschia maritima]|uniref:NAD+ synthase n=1 Tax=Hirschia maritima TaxID=1121961 RepID=UPI00037ABB85|nr:NAD+ synthase [Hirschia maritima]